MSLDIPAIQRTLAAERIDGWLLYDFHGSNPIARNLVGLTQSGKMTTRRWYYFIPASGEPKKIVHAIESGTLEHLPGDTVIYAGRRVLEERVSTALIGSKVLAMEYSPECAIPYIGRVDAGTIEFLRRLGMRIISSGDLVQRFEAIWDEAAIKTHRKASEGLYKIKDQTFAYIGAKLSAGGSPTEYEVQQQMQAWFRELGMINDHAPIVAAQEHAGDPHYGPSADNPRAIKPNEVVLLDLWGKLDQPGSVYADITWTGFAGDDVPAEIETAWRTIVAGRDAGIAKVQSAMKKGEELHGWEVDRATRDVIDAAGFAAEFMHRTGHSLGEEVHGNGVHMDDYETRDERLIIPGTGFTIEPGIYTRTFGVRTEINMVVGQRSAEVTGPCQKDLVRIATRR